MENIFCVLSCSVLFNVCARAFFNWADVRTNTSEIIINRHYNSKAKAKTKSTYAKIDMNHIGHNLIHLCERAKERERERVGECRLHFSLIRMFPFYRSNWITISHKWWIRHPFFDIIAFVIRSLFLSSTCGSSCLRFYCLHSTFGFFPLQNWVERIFHSFLLTQKFD